MWLPLEFCGTRSPVGLVPRRAIGDSDSGALDPGLALEWSVAHSFTIRDPGTGGRASAMAQHSTTPRAPSSSTQDQGPAATGARVRILLVDDHALVRHGLRRILEDEPDLAVVGEAGTGEEAISLATGVRPDVIVLDMAMPDINGLQAAREILKQRPGSRILILSMYADEQYVRNALDAGVHGYILKGSLATDMVRAVRAVANGQQYLSPELSGHLIRALQTRSTQSEPDPYDRLTPREKQVLQLIAQGKSNKEIAVLLDLSVNTVAVHRTNLMNTLQLHKAAELVLYAVKKGLVIPE